MNILIIEDELIWSNKIEMMLLEFELKVIGIAPSLKEASIFLSKNEPDLVISDVMLGKEYIFDLFENDTFRHLPFLFITNSLELINYEKAKELKNSGFLVKPFHSISLKSAIDNLMKNYEKNNNNLNKIGIEVKGKYNEKIFVKASDILYVQAERNYCYIKTKNYAFSVKKSLLNLGKELDNTFLQIHRSYIFNKIYFENIEIKNMHFEVNNERIKIGRKYRKEVLDYLNSKISI